MKVQDILTDESKWTKRTAAVDKDGWPVDPANSDACKWCLWGAIFAAYKERGASVVNDVSKELHLRGKLSKHQGIGIWNDAPRRSFKQIRKFIEELDI